QGSSLDTSAYAIGVGGRGSFKPLVKFIKPPVYSLRLGIHFHGSEQQRTEGWSQRKRYKSRNQYRNGDGDGKLLVQPPYNARNKTHRNEYRRQNEGNGNDRSGDVFHGLPCSFLGRHLFVIDIMLGCFYHHNGVVHHNTDGQHKPKECEGVDGKSEGT